MKLRNFDLEEFKCNCGECSGYPKEGMSEVLMTKLDELRDLVGYPIYVTNGYRCHEHNAAVGGVENSQHVLGTAADIYCNYKTAEELYDLALQVGFDGLGLYVESGFVHVDCRDGGKNPNYYLWEE